ncbi:DNA-binding protein [Bacillus cereus]|nr:DNA-binding protein [Bacillus cereus]
MEQEQSILNTTEVKQYLGISHFILNNLLKQKHLIPINQETWRLDGSFLFKKEEVEEIKQKRERNGLTLYQASRTYGIGMYQLEKWIEEGTLAVVIQEHRNRPTAFVKEEDVLPLIEQVVQTNTRYSYSQKHHIALFQQFVNGNTIARIMSIPKRGAIVLQDEFGQEFTLTEARQRGYVPGYTLPETPRSHHQRFVTFRIPKSDALRSHSFQVIDRMLQYISPRNLKISEKDGFWYVDVRQSLFTLPMGMQEEWVETVTPYIIEGKIIKRVNHSVYLDSQSVTKSITLSHTDYQAIQNIVEETSSTLEAFLTSAVRDKIRTYQEERTPVGPPTTAARS